MLDTELPGLKRGIDVGARHGLGKFLARHVGSTPPRNTQAAIRMIHRSLLKGDVSNPIGNGTVKTHFWCLLSLVSCPEWGVLRPCMPQGGLSI